MFRHLDLTLREIGVQDLGVGPAHQDHGRRASMAGPWPIARPWPAVRPPLGEVLRRNAYGGRPPADAEAVARLEAHVRAMSTGWPATPRNDLIK